MAEHTLRRFMKSFRAKPPDAEADSRAVQVRGTRMIYALMQAPCTLWWTWDRRAKGMPAHARAHRNS
jgi:hypothetical protein